MVSPGSVILALKIAVAAVTVLLEASLRSDNQSERDVAHGLIITAFRVTHAVS